jgi:hypothetical protein
MDACWHRGIFAKLFRTRKGYRAFVLCQVANDVQVTPKYKTFNCFLNREE